MKKNAILTLTIAVIVSTLAFGLFAGDEKTGKKEKPEPQTYNATVVIEEEKTSLLIDGKNYYARLPQKWLEEIGLKNNDNITVKGYLKESDKEDRPNMIMIKSLEFNGKEYIMAGRRMRGGKRGGMRGKKGFKHDPNADPKDGKQKRGWFFNKKQTTDEKAANDA